MAIKKILIVCDQPPNPGGALDVLERAGFLPVLAQEGSAALKYLSSRSTCDLILLELSSRDEEVLSLLETLRALFPQIPVIVVSASGDVRTATTAMKIGVRDYLVKPVVTKELLSSVGAALDGGKGERRDSTQLQTLERLVEARTEMLSRVIADLERSYDITLEALGNALDLKDAETEGHSKRVTAYTIVLARAMRLDPGEIKVIARGAFLHDIGKMAIPDAILTKPGKLSAEEQTIMREHCLRGYLMLRKIPFLEGAAEIVFSHQERYDGQGYSRGLKGNEIPLGARIFSLADALDAITSDRPYRKAQSFPEARREIECCSGTQFDPDVVAVYRRLPDRIWEDLRVEINTPTGDISTEISESFRTN